MMKTKLTPERLRDRCTEVPADDIPQLRPLIDGMFEICDGKTCIGLAANQVGHAVRVIVINCHGFRQAIINPKIEKTFGGVHASEEGCMSFPGLKVRVIRPKRVRVSGLGPDGDIVSFSPKNALICRAILHEVDHLNGIIMQERARHQDLPYE